MIRRGFKSAVLLVVVGVALSGCLRNTPGNVAKRFVKSIKEMKWEKMEKLVDWTASGARTANRRELLTDVAEHLTRYEIREYGEKRARSYFLYLRVTKIETLKRTDRLARLRVDLSMSREQTMTFDMTLRKVDRTWRVVITPDLLP